MKRNLILDHKHNRILMSRDFARRYTNTEGDEFKHTFALSPAGIAKEFGMPESTCKDQIEKLIKKNYLVQRKAGSNQYDLYETPQNPSVTVKAEASENEQDVFQLL